MSKSNQKSHKHIAGKLSACQRRLGKLFRKLTVVIIAACVVAALIAADRTGVFGQKASADLQRYHNKTGKITHIVDGDTLDIEIPDEKKSNPRTRLRLWGVDTPETVKPNTPVQYFGPQASSFARKQTLNKTVRLELLAHNTRGKYGRVLAYVYLPDGRLLNLEIIAQGLGFADPRFEHPRKAEFARAMVRARKQGLGLWKNPKPEDWPYYLKKDKP